MCTLPAFIDLIAKGDSDVKNKLKGYEEVMKGVLSGLNEEQAKAWAAKQSYIALGFGLAASAELGIDSCPMEGFDPEAFKKILKLPKNFYPQALLAVGYRSKDDVVRPKVRFGKEELFSI